MLNEDRPGAARPTMKDAIAELEATIRHGFLSAVFSLKAGEACERLSVVVTVDVDDPADVLDLVVKRVADLQVGVGIRLHALPEGTPAQMQEMCRGNQRGAPPR